MLFYIRPALCARCDVLFMMLIGFVVFLLRHLHIIGHWHETLVNAYFEYVLFLVVFRVLTEKRERQK